MSLSPEFLIGLAVLAAVVLFVLFTRPKPPTAVPLAPLMQAPPDHAQNALASLELAERQAAARLLGEALGKHHLGQMSTAMGIATTATPTAIPAPLPPPPAPPAPKA